MGKEKYMNNHYPEHTKRTGGPADYGNYEKKIMLLSEKHNRLQTLIHYVNKVNLMKERQ